MYAMILFKNGIPLSIVAQGVVLGALYSLTAMGMVLIYRTMKIVNFAQAAIGGLAGSVALLATSGWGLNYFVAILIGIVVSIVTGFLVEITVIRRLVDSPRLIITVATIGILEILGAAEVGLPHLASNINITKQLTTPFNININLKPIPFSGNDIVALVGVIVVLLVLTLFMQKSKWGLSMRAVGSSNERALLLGISVKKVLLITWILAALLSGVSSILTAPIVTPSLGTAASPVDLLIPLAAFTLAGFESFSLTLVWSVVIGVFQQVVFWSYPNSSTIDVGLFVLILLGLLFRRRGDMRQDDPQLASFAAIRAIHSLPSHLQEMKKVKILKYASLFICLLLSVVVPIFMSTSQQVLMTYVAIFVLVAISLVTLSGWAGQISFGQFGLVGIGAAACSTFLIRLHVDLIISLLLAGLFGGLVAIIIGIPALRLAGLNLAAATFAFSVPVSTWLLSNAQFPYINPSFVPRPFLFNHINLAGSLAFYEFCLVTVVIVMVGAYNFSKTRSGRVLLAVRDNSLTAGAYGISPYKTKLMAFGLSGALAGIAGGLYVLALGGVGFAGIDPNQSIVAFTMVVVGGLGSLTGAIAGALYVELVQYFLPGGFELLASGAGLLLLLLIIPEGIGGIIYKLRDLFIYNVLKLDRQDSKSFIAQNLESNSDDIDKVNSSEAAGDLSNKELTSGKTYEASMRFTALENTELQETSVNLLGEKEDTSDFVLFTDKISCDYDKNRILYDVSFGIEKGEVLAFLGTNGSGKSTTLKAIAGLIKLENGDIFYNNKSILKLSVVERVRQGIVTVFGGHGIFSDLTVKENLVLPLRFKNSSGSDSAVNYSIENVLRMFPRLQERLNFKAGVLSGGEQQMLAIAQSLLLNPKVLLIDELLLGISPAFATELIVIIESIAKQGVAIVVVEQSISAAAKLSRKAIFLERGKIRFSGPTPSLADQPKLLRSVFLKAATGAEGKERQVRTQALEELSEDSSVLSFSAIKAINLSKHYQGIHAIENVSLAVSPGDILGIIGPNGAGKTTLLHCLSGIIKPSSGSVLMSVANKDKVENNTVLQSVVKDVTKLSPSSRAKMGLGTIFQNAPLFSTMTVMETVQVACEKSVEVKDPLLSLFPVPSVKQSESHIKEIANNVISITGLNGFKDKFIFELSTGTRRIVEIACILAHKPRVLLLDEPSSGIAQRETAALADVLDGIRAEYNTTFIIIEHDIPLISKLADRLMCLALGKAVIQGTPSEVLAHPDVAESYLSSVTG